MIPKYTSTSYPLTISFGLASNKELALKTQYIYRNEDPNIKSRGIDDTELSFKWTVLPQPENRYRPGLAVIATGILPTGDREAGTNSVNHWGCRAGLALGSEIVWEDHIIALYADGQVALTKIASVPAADFLSTTIVGMTPDNKGIHLLTTLNRDKVALMAMSLADGTTTPIAEDGRADVDEVLLEPQTREVLAYSASFTRREWHSVQKGFERHLVLYKVGPHRIGSLVPPDDHAC